MDKNHKYEIIKILIETNGSKKILAFEIGYMDRHINSGHLSY
jgi:hypothetical protein